MAAPAPPAGRPKWLVLGGLGFIGRNVVKYLVDNGLASDIRIVDKKAPFMAFLSPDYKAAIMENPVVECVQADISDEDMCGDAFRDSRAGGSWDYVVHAAAETALGKRDEFYAKTVEGARLAGTMAARIGAKKYVFLSTSHVYKSSSSPVAEDGKTGPWTAVADACLKAEQALQAIPGLPLVILRPALVYGPGDFTTGMMPRVVVAAAYKKLGERMDMLWDGDMRMSTVHVFDVARAVVHAARKGSAGAVFNLADKANSDQGKICALLSSIFSIEHGFFGSMKSNLAALKLDVAVDAANEQHLGPWLALLKDHGIRNTPLSPFLHKSLLAHNHNAVDGSAIEGATGFKYAVPEPSVELVRDPVLQHIAQGIFPPIL